MTGFWHPVSAVYLDRPRVLASPAVLRLMLAGEGRAEIVYAGDRMWPAIRHGEALVVSPLPPEAPAEGEIVLTLDGGIPDVMRLTREGGAPAVAADADPGPPRPVRPLDLLGRVAGARGGRAPWRTLFRRWLDLAEATVAGPDAGDDPALTVRTKYDDQALHYDRLDGVALEPRLAARIEESVPNGSRILVAGSGTGREAFALERLGYRVTGVDFAARMVEAATAEAARRGSSVTFRASDLRSHDELQGSLGAVVFTYDVYSFVPGARARIAVLRRLRTWLAPCGVLFLSARRARGLWTGLVLTVQWLARISRGSGGAWGDSHTRWLDASGAMRRSFVHVFSDRRLDREASAAGFRRVVWEGGHGLFVAKSDAASRDGA